MKTYMASRRARQADEQVPNIHEKGDDMLRLLKNNAAIDLKSYEARLWLVAADLKSAKNILASAQLIVVQSLTATPHPARRAKRTTLSGFSAKQHI
jgi:hypothetical protein